MKRCGACGRDNRVRAAFCAGCGEAFAGSSDRPRSGAVTAETGARLLVVALGVYLALLVTNLTLALAEVTLAQLRAVEVVLLLVVLVAAQVGSRRPEILAPASIVRPPTLTFGLAAQLAAGVAAALLAAAVLSLASPMTDVSLMERYRAEGAPAALAFLDLSLIAPLLEELAFRSLILGALVVVFGRSGALWASSLMFATLHLSPISFVHHTLLGLACGHARLKTNSLLLPVLIHAGYNAVVVLAAW
jgi:membrane protease YdiL (CAAX protease family)